MSHMVAVIDEACKVPDDKRRRIRSRDHFRPSDETGDFQTAGTGFGMLRGTGYCSDSGRDQPRRHGPVLCSSRETTQNRFC